MKTLREELLEAYPDCGPDWRAAIEYGIDVSLLEENLRLTVGERIRQLDQMAKLFAALRPPATEDGPANR